MSTRCARRSATSRTDSRTSIRCLAAAIVLPRLFGKSSLQLPQALLPETLFARRATVDDSLATSPIAPDGERKHATVLDCRIANAAAVVERLGPVAARELTRELLTMAAEEIGRYGGVITERHADGFVALFGAPIVHEDDSPACGSGGARHPAALWTACGAGVESRRAARSADRHQHRRVGRDTRGKPRRSRVCRRR